MNIRSLKQFFMASFMLAAIFPAFTFFYIYPKVERLSVSQMEEASSRIAAYLASRVLQDGELGPTERIQDVLRDVSEIADLGRIRIYSDKGAMLYSTDAEDFLTIHDTGDLWEGLRRGVPYSKIKRAGAYSSEGETMESDMVETYVALMVDGRFIGVLEVYSNTGRSTGEMKRMFVDISVIVLLVVSGVLALQGAVVVFSGSRKAGKKGRSTRVQSPVYMLVVVAVAIFVAEAAVMMFLPMLPGMSAIERAIFDAGWLLLLVGPMLYYYVFRPLGSMLADSVEAEKTLKGLLKDKEMMIREIYHRVKNNLQAVSSLLSLHARQVEDERVSEALLVSESRVRSMGMMHEMLYGSADLRSVEAREFFNSLTARLLRTQYTGTARISLRVDVEDVRLDVDDMVPCGLIVNELFTNALKYAFEGREEGVIGLSFRREGAGSESCQYILGVEDDGVGLPEGFDPDAESRSLGMKLVSSLANQLGGKVAWSSNGGARFSVSFELKGCVLQGNG